MKRFRLLTVLATMGLLVSACGGSSGGNSSGAGAGKLVIDNETGSTWTCHFNPFNPSVNGASNGFVYETLESVDILHNASATPWLATRSQWSNGYKTLTFTIRSGVKWSDGQPFTGADVVYTFDAMKADKAIDLNAVWESDSGPLTNVALEGANQVVFTFNAPSQPYFFYIANLTPIVPQHIWSTLNQSKLATYNDASPIGTGPYLVSSCTGENIKYLRNPHYWQSTPAIRPGDQGSRLPRVPQQHAGQSVPFSGQAQWGGQYIPNVNSFYVGKDPAHRHIWYPPVLNVALIPNLQNALLSQLPVRQALAYAINRATVARLGEGGEQQAANQTGVLLPTYQSWYDSSLPKFSYDPAKAQQILTSAGFTKGSNGIFQKGGQPLSFTIKTISGYSDWDASLAVITQELKAVGISVTVQDENSSPYTTELQTGHFQLAYGGSGSAAQLAGPTPYYELRGYLFSGNIGTTDYPHLSRHRPTPCSTSTPAPARRSRSESSTRSRR